MNLLFYATKHPNYTKSWNWPRTPSIAKATPASKKNLPPAMQWTPSSPSWPSKRPTLLSMTVTYEPSCLTSTPAAVVWKSGRKPGLGAGGSSGASAGALWLLILQRVRRAAPLRSTCSPILPPSSVHLFAASMLPPVTTAAETLLVTSQPTSSTLECLAAWHPKLEPPIMHPCALTLLPEPNTAMLDTVPPLISLLSSCNLLVACWSK
mmetsp:Transcript_14531/g.39322  ORF Transcript_14531/g.39322 Transcript_14531/m.39322 type:complete len:208 (-) Transcript_14531:1051-1674(-)